MNELSKQYKKDVSSIDSIIDALYEVISGEEVEERDWARERNLFHPDARLIVAKKEGVQLVYNQPHEWMFLKELKQ